VKPRGIVEVQGVAEAAAGIDAQERGGVRSGDGAAAGGVDGEAGEVFGGVGDGGAGLDAVVEVADGGFEDFAGGVFGGRGAGGGAKGHDHGTFNLKAEMRTADDADAETLASISP
jgi:hypothetical protein